MVYPNQTNQPIQQASISKQPVPNSYEPQNSRPIPTSSKWGEENNQLKASLKEAKNTIKNLKNKLAAYSKLEEDFLSSQKEKEQIISKYPSEILSVKPFIMDLVYSKFRSIAAELQLWVRKIALGKLPTPPGLFFGSLCYKRDNPHLFTTACNCDQGIRVFTFSIFLEQWQHTNELFFDIYNSGFLSRLVITKMDQIDIYIEKISHKMAYTCRKLLLPNRWINVELRGIPASYRTYDYPDDSRYAIFISSIDTLYPVSTYLLRDFMTIEDTINLSEDFEPIQDQINSYRALIQSNEKEWCYFNNSRMIFEEHRIKGFINEGVSDYGLKLFIPFLGHIHHNPRLTEHYQQVRAHYSWKIQGEMAKTISGGIYEPMTSDEEEEEEEDLNQNGEDDNFEANLGYEGIANLNNE